MSWEKCTKIYLGHKKGTTEDIIYTEINRCNIIEYIKQRQFNFFQKFKRLGNEESSAKCIFEKYLNLEIDNKHFLEYYNNLNYQDLSENMQIRRNRIFASNNTMQIRYRNLFNCRFNETLYDSYRNNRVIPYPLLIFYYSPVYESIHLS